MESEKLQMNDLPDFFTPDMLSAVLPLSKSTLYRALRRGTIPCLRVGKRFILSRTYLEQRRKPGFASIMIPMLNTAHLVIR